MNVSNLPALAAARVPARAPAITATRTSLACCAFAAALAVVPVAAHAGILRDVMNSVGLSKPAPVGPDGVPSFPRQGYACCDLHYDKDWINDGNYAELPMIPAERPSRS